jgi:Spy/CpxP family protein refolding chaperone
MNKLLPLLILPLAGLFAMPAAVQAEDAKPKPPGERRGPGGPGGRMNPEERLKMMTEKLGLSEEQQTKIKAIQEKNGPAMKELMAKGRENLSEEDKTKLRELGKAQMEEIGAVLTPEQKEKMKELRGAGGPGGEGRRKPGAGKPGAAPKPEEKK